MAPRQRATFDKKGKVKSMNYKEYSPRQEKASAQLESYIRNNQDKKNEAPGIKSILQDMPQKKADFVRRNVRKDGTLNSAAQALLAPYRDERPEYSRQLNRLVKSSPEMAQAYEKRFPIQNFMQNVAPRFMPGIGQLFSADQGMKANAAKQAIMNTPVNRPEGGFKNFVDFFKKDMTGDQAAKINIIETENKPFVNPQDMNLQKAQPFVSPADMNLQEAQPYVNPQDMGFLDSELIFDPEKAAIKEALTPGNVFNPVAADKQSKIDFINKVEGTNYTVEAAEVVFGGQGKSINDMFERSKQKQGNEIRDSIAGQFNLAGPTVDEGIILEGADSDYQDVPYRTDGIPAEAFKDAVLPGDPRFPAPYGFEYKLPEVSSNQNVSEPFDGTEVAENLSVEKYRKIKDESPWMSDEAIKQIYGMDVLDDIPLIGYPPTTVADGGYLNKFDDGGYANMSTFEKLKMMADNYGK